MKLRFFSTLALAVNLNLLITLPAGWADKLELKDGTQIEGLVQKVEKGQVAVQVGPETETFDILNITRMTFDTPRLETGTPRLPLEHFLTNIEAQEMLGHFQAVENLSSDVRGQIEQAQKGWGNRKTIEPGELRQWEAAKERFSTPLTKYQEAINDLYFHVLGKLDEYNQLAKEADSIYVGVKGVFQTGSSLIPKQTERLPLKKYVPSNWYDTIFYEGYDLGYREAFQKYGANPHAAPPSD